MSRLLKFVLRTKGDRHVFERMASENYVIYRKQYAIAIICLLVGAATAPFSAFIMGPIVQDVFYGQQMDAAIFFSLLVVAIFALKGVATFIQTVILERIGNNIVARYQRRLFAHLMKLDVGFFTSQHSVVLISKLNQNIAAVRTMLNTVLLGLVRDLVTLVGLVGVMLYRDIYMSLAFFIIGPIALGTLSRYARRVKAIARQEVRINSQVAAAMQEGAHGISVVKAFTMEEQLGSKLDTLTEEAEARSNKIAIITARTAPLMETIAGFAIAAVIAYGGWRVINQGYNPSDLTSFMTALLMAYEPAKRLARLRVTLERSLTNARMIYEVLDTEPNHHLTDESSDFAVDSGRIEFRDVTFRYVEHPSSDDEDAVPMVAPPPVISNMSFVAEAGETTALVGPSGGGKSTIVGLIQRFYDPEEGAILIDGQNIASVPSKSLRSGIAYVSQQPILFQGTVRENLRYARPDASDADIVTAAKNAQAHDFITALPDGYDTLLGENGVNLSGGQRQRLSIARAIVRDAPILLLDEATSALDNESEALVQSALDALMDGRTTIVIAHRLSTISNADRILVIDGGKVVDEGSHGELLGNKHGVYSRLHNAGSV